jgi:general secretion pathway protein I
MSARAFTLLEVMVALAILALGFGVIVEAHSRAALATIDARQVTVGTLLARGKMLDLEQELRKDGFGDGDKVIDGDFGEEGYAEYKYTAVLRKIEIPVGKLQDGQAPDIMAMLGGGGAGEQGGGSGEATSAPNMGMLGPVFQIASDVVGNSVRELTLVVTLPEGGRLADLKVTTHVVDDVRLGQELAKIPGMGGLASLAAGGGLGAGLGLPGQATGTNTSTSPTPDVPRTADGKIPPGASPNFGGGATPPGGGGSIPNFPGPGGGIPSIPGGKR